LRVKEMLSLKSLSAIVIFVVVMLLQTWIGVRFARPAFGKHLSYVVFTSLSIILALFLCEFFRNENKASLPRIVGTALFSLFLTGCFWVYLVKYAHQKNFGMADADEAAVGGAGTMTLAAIFLLYAGMSALLFMPLLEWARPRGLTDARLSQLVLTLHSSLNVLGVVAILVPRSLGLSAHFGVYYFFAAPALLGTTLCIILRRLVFDSRGAIVTLLISTILLVPG
jgi:hypothetical protein